MSSTSRGRLRKESLTDSLKLNRKWLAEQRNKRDESKFRDESDDEENSGRVLNLNSNRKTKCLERKKKSAELLNYLDSVRSEAEGERDEIRNQSSYVRDRRYDWEENDDDDMEVGFIDGDHSNPPLAPSPPANNAEMISSPPPLSKRSDNMPSPAFSRRSYMESTSTISSGHSSRSKSLVMKLELEEKSKTIEALKKALKQVRHEKGEIVQKSVQENKKAMAEQRASHEKAVARHLGFIDKLLADKKLLSSKVEEMSDKMKKTEEIMSRKLRDLENKHEMDLKRVKENLAQVDATKRQKWQKEKTRELKELTIKGLEPEVQNILAKHKEDLRAIEEKFKEEIHSLKEKHDRERLMSHKELRAQHELELEEMRSKERTSMVSKLREVESRHQAELKSQRERYEAEFHDIRERHKDEVKEAHSQIKRRVDESAAHSHQEMLEQKRRLESQLENLEEKFNLEKEKFEAKIVRKYQEKAEADEKRLKQKLVGIRDKQIDAVISKLQAEQEGKMAQMKQEHAEALKEMKDRMASQLDIIQSEAEEWKEKYNKVLHDHRQEKKTFSSAESRVRELQQLAEKREARIVQLSKKVASINDIVAEREQQVRSEYAERNAQHIKRHAKLQETIDQLKHEISNGSTSQKQKIKELQSGFEQETDEIHRRVRITISRKDETIQALRDQLEEMEQKFESYSEILEKQRQDFLQS